MPVLLPVPHHVEVPYPGPGGGVRPGAHGEDLPAAAPAAPVVRAAHCNDDNGNSVLVLAKDQCPPLPSPRAMDL